MIAKLLVANRGEIAARVLRTARAMGVATVAVFSDPDRDAPFVARADEAVPLGGAAPADSYLRAEAILEAAARTGADAIHPGYGFLAEDAEFASGCRKRGLVFVGPPPEVLAALGNKVEAKRVAAAAGVPVLPGVEVAGPGGAVGEGAEVAGSGGVAPEGSGVAGADGGGLVAAGRRVGFPLLVKATFGGGGIGMAVVRDPDGLAGAVAAARRQAGSAFGNDAVFLERRLEAPRHVEVQILADTAGRMVQLFERECSIQRRHQKLVEEAPSPAVGPDLRRRLGEAALAVANAVGYVGAGTVEFLLDGEEFWFLEANARLQVEHPVTEAVTGLDLVRLQLLVAAGEPLPPEALEPRLRGHAIEARLYAEDPAAGFLPQSGTLHRFRFPPGPPGSPPAGIPGPPPGGWGVRVDAGVADGSVVGVHYDPLLAKVIAHAPTREEAARLLAATLDRARLHGVVTNRDLLVGLLGTPAFLAGETDTGFLCRHPPSELTARASADPSAAHVHAAAAALAAQAERRATTAVYPTVPSGWRNNPSQLQRAELSSAGTSHGPGAVVSVGYRFDRTGRLETLEVDGAPLVGSRLWHCRPDLVDLEVEGIRRRFEVHLVGHTAYVDSPLGHTEFRDPTTGGPPGRPGGLWTTAGPQPGDRLRSPTGGPGAEPGGFGAAGLGEGVAGPGEGAGGPGEGAGGPREGMGDPVGGAGVAVTDGAMVSTLPGVVRRVAVRVGERVEAGMVVVILEAMKTEHRIAATRAGTVRRVLVVEGQEVAAGTTVIELEEGADG